MDSLKGKFNYIYSCHIDINIPIKIGTLDNYCQSTNYRAFLNEPSLKFSSTHKKIYSDLRVMCQVYHGNHLLSLPIYTSYKPFISRQSWNEWLTLPLKFCDLPRNAILVFTIYDYLGPNKSIPVGWTAVPLFARNGVFCQGMFDLKIFPGCEVDPDLFPTLENNLYGSKQMQRLTLLTRQHHNGLMNKVDWLDRLTFREIEQINEREKRTSQNMYLMVEFPQIEYEQEMYSLVWFESGGQNVFEHLLYNSIVKINDPETELENLHESKHHKLARPTRFGLADRDLKPNATIRDLLNIITQYPPTKQLTSDEQDKVWQYRFFLSSQKKGLTKFLKCVNWKLPDVTKQALALMHEWAPPDADDALELLGPSFTHPEVRTYAVERLSCASNEDFLLYMPQLVQALKYESQESSINIFDITHYSSDSENATCELVSAEQSDINTDLLEKALKTSITKSQSSSIEESDATVVEQKLPVVTSEHPDETFNAGIAYEVQKSVESPKDLASLLINRACQNNLLANYLYWYLYVECEEQDLTNSKLDTKIREMYMLAMRKLKVTLQQGNKEAMAVKNSLVRQHVLIENLVTVVKLVSKESGNRMRRIEKLQFLLSEFAEKIHYNFTNFEPLPLPLDPEVIVCGLIPEKASLFKSALQPSRLTFKTVDGWEYVAIFKYGDDLRQDQLILQMITLMDRLLQQEHLDLRLTPYKVLATSTKHGFVQYIDSYAVAEVLQVEGTIQNFFRKHTPSENSPYNISPDVMDNYIKSCAGYCVITYLLGIGDRHLDNLLLTTSGNLFHIDFGYILGRDPKPLPPPMKLSKEMVEGMGGANSDHYHQFRKLCYTAFHQLRRHANLILNLFSLMVDASVPDIALEPDKTVKKVEDKFRLDLSDEEAVSYMQRLIDDSVNAVFAAMVEQFHKIAQYIRK